MQTSAHYKLSYDEFLPPECFLNQSECDSSDLDLLRSKFLENNSYTYTYKQKYRKFALVRVQQSLLEKAEHEQCLRGLEIITSGCKPTLEEETDISVFMVLLGIRLLFITEQDNLCSVQIMLFLLLIKLTIINCYVLTAELREETIF